MEGRRKFRREGEERRRQDLIEATLECVAERGLQGATVRAIALRAGVTAGLIRHYFPSKEELLQAAYAAIMGRMTEQSKAALAKVAQEPRRRLAAFVEASLQPPVIDARVFSQWASFIGRASSDPALAVAHRAGYLGFRDEVEALVAEVLTATGRDAPKAELRRYAIAINAIIDGLWIEGCLAGDFFEPRELAEIGIGSVEDMLGLKLRQPTAPPLPPLDGEGAGAPTSPVFDVAVQKQKKKTP
ncbi:transcriptional regulator, TetR family [Mesorhizobium albiziae]|uniref:Transcriptional regulator, TetR family n=1 Tax=Neomesorhizobium albiziae TaxID=335020 RepID=A0A1I3WZE1_9HYPH|nr:TetR family transcriptional regulator C-terminal domain-containing protein [Mesorhizobium albiziae]GLS31939.1 TetR family transcriptional regulator [Mesorhizobium albiziae]SFK11861.1 transcriptional regulator, TetR family [Mesorhizobium albiziae]